MTGFDPDWRVAPGETLKEWMSERGLDVSQLAEMANMQKTHVRDVLNGSALMNQSTAGRLEVATGIATQLWLNLEREYRRP